MTNHWYRLDLIEETRGKRKDRKLAPIYIYRSSEEQCRTKLKHIGSKRKRINRRGLHIQSLIQLSETGSKDLEREIMEESSLTLHQAKRHWYSTSSVYD